MITYRPMISLDLPVVVTMEREVYRTDAWSVGQFKEELANVPKSRVYIVAVNEKTEIVGYAGAFSPDLSLDVDVLTLTVSPTYRRQGIGRAMLKDLIAWAQERKAPAIYLEVREGNEEASPLYLSEGFEAISRRSNYYSLGVNAVVMKKDLQ
ncbi:MAG: ribosomal protein S18-alanine N-acetyltransferase [Candidatus Nanopelagicaceae bacterium]|nr:ribosomal protein S18-alanine N-acetyltransferase [Candidatus Nanopelagicaceae bacterium]